MNRQPDLELVLREYLADDNGAAPDHVLDVVESRIAGHPRRTAWRLRGRPFMNATAKLAAGIAAVLIVAVIGIALVLRPGGSTVGTSNPSAAPSPSLLPTGYPIGGLLPAGSHTTNRFSPAVTFTVPEGWIKTADEAPGAGQLGLFGLMQDTPASRAEFARTSEAAPGILLVAGLTSPYYVCQSWEDNQGGTAAEMVAKVTANPKLRTSGVRDVTIGGLTGKQFDVRASPDAMSETCPGDAPGTKPSDVPGRSILLDAPRGGVLVMFVATPGTDADFEAHLGQAMPVVESFKFARAP